MLYFFHLLDGTDTLLDDEGRELPDIAAVRKWAAEEARCVMAGEVRSGRLNLGQRIEVQDEAGQVVHIEKFTDAVQVTRDEGDQG